MTTEITTQPKVAGFDLSPQTFEQALTFSQYLADSDMVPKDFKGKPGNCLVAIQWGMEIGLKPLQAMQNIAVINGRPSLWGDSVIALARNSPVCEYIIEEDDGRTATCKVKRRGEPEQSRTFSMEDAKIAGLLGKQGPWTQYPKRMRQMRARAFAIRDVFPDVLKGLPVAEELMDMPQSTPINTRTGDVMPVASMALIDAANAAADGGRDSFAKWWKAAKPEDRKALADHVNDLKSRTESADKNRTVDTTPKADESTGEIVVTFEDVITKLDKAKNEDALYVAYDWANAMQDQSRMPDVEAHFNARLAAIRGE
jgi:hypothetical protein